MDAIHSNIKFKIDGVDKEVDIIHNLPNEPFHSFEEAFSSWVHRTKEYTSQSLVDYIKSKNLGQFVITKEEYNKIRNE